MSLSQSEFVRLRPRYCVSHFHLARHRRRDRCVSPFPLARHCQRDQSGHSENGLAHVGELLLCIEVRRGSSKPFGGDGRACVLMA